LYLEHPTTGEREHVADYIVRHTLARPRDVVFVGRRIADLAPSERRPERVRAAVNMAASQIAASYIRECEPHLAGFEADALFPLIEKNGLSRAEVEEIALKYHEATGGVLDDPLDVMATLHRIGLLGHVGRLAAAPGRDIQFFQALAGRPSQPVDRLP